MSSKVTGWVWEQDLALQRKCVLLWLAERATDHGVCFPGQAEIRKKTGLSESMVRRYLHWLAGEVDDRGSPKQPLVRIIQRRVPGQRNTSNVYVLLVPWAEPEVVQRELDELKHVPEAALEGVGSTGAPQVGGVHPCAPVGGTGAPQVGVAGDTQELSLPEPDREYSPLPPIEQQQRGVVKIGTDDAAAIRTPPELTGDHDSESQATVLVEAFYAGLDTDVGAVTTAIRRRDLAIARQLVRAGANAEEAEAYAREMVASANRLAPVDLRSFERERAGWLARRRGRRRPATGFVDRTGQPPSWQTPLEDPGTRTPAAQSSAETLAGVQPVQRRGVHGDAFTALLTDLVDRTKR